MSPKRRHATIPMVAILLVAAVAPAFAGGTAMEGPLAVAATQDDSGAVTVTVTHNGTGVENATVTVTALNNSSYAGAGEHVTDANGTVSLSAPAENVTVEVNATKGNATGSLTTDLVAVESEEPGEPGEFDSFGQRVAWFVHELLGDDGREGGIGDAVSEFVTSNNPGSDEKPDHAGKPAKAGNSANETSGGGPPEHANNDKGDDDSDE